MNLKIIVLLFCFLWSWRLDAQSLYDKAYNEYLNGDLNKSVALFDKCIQKGEDTVHAYLYRAAGNIFLEHYEDAVRDLEKVNQIDSTTYKLHFFWAKLYLSLQDYDKALTNYNVEIAKYPGEASAYEERAVVKCLSEDYNGAFADYKKALELKPNDAITYLDRGALFIDLKRYNEAINDLNTSLKIERSKKAYMDLGLAHYATDSNTLAIDEYTHALEFDPNDSAILLYFRGASYKAINLNEKACADLKKSLSLGYDDAKEILNKLNCN